VLWSKINPSSIENDRQIVEHERNKVPIEELEYQLNESRNQFRAYVLTQLFDFRTGIGLVSRLNRDVESAAGSFNEETLPYTKELLKQMQAIQEVANKFQHQMLKIFMAQPVNEDFLSERLMAASGFFKTKIENLLETLRQSPATTDSRENARDYNDQLSFLFGYIEQKQHVLKSLKMPFAVEDYFLLKNTFLLPDFTVNAYAKTGNTKSVASRHPKLYFQLLTLRNQLCEPADLPIYLVAGSKTLLEMADYLPLTEKDLLKINGFGPAKVEKYGSQFLNIIQRYCSENKLSTMMGEVIETKRETKEKKPKGDSHRTSFEMYKQGKPIDEIATERALAVSTICTHLGVYVNSGALDINKFVSVDKRTAALKMIEESKELGSAHQMLSDTLTPVEISFFLSWMRGQNRKE